MIRINAADLHQRVGEILSKIRFDDARFVIERRGVPVAAVVTMQDFERLEGMTGKHPTRRSKDERRAALKRAQAVRQLILSQRHGKYVPSSAETVRMLRDERAQRYKR